VDPIVPDNSEISKVLTKDQDPSPRMCEVKAIKIDPVIDAISPRIVIPPEVPASTFLFRFVINLGFLEDNKPISVAKVSAIEVLIVPMNPAIKMSEAEVHSNIDINVAIKLLAITFFQDLAPLLI